jgi:hypothetical protein
VRPRVLIVSLALVAGGCGRIGYEQVTDGGGIGGPGDAGTDRRPGDGGSPAGDSAAGSEAGGGAGGTGGSGGSTGGTGGGTGGTGGSSPAPDGGTADGPPQDMPSVDAPPEQCTEAFSRPEVVLGLGLIFDLYGPRPTANALGLYFSATRGAPYDDEDIYYIERPNRGADFNGARRVDELSSQWQDGTPFPAVDEVSMYFTSSRPGGRGRRDVWLARRATPTAPFQMPSNINGLNSDATDQGPTVTADGLTLFFASTRTGGQGQEDLWVATRPNTTSAWGSAIINLEEINTGAVEGAPFISPDGLVLYFVSDRPGGRGRRDIWRTSRGSLTERFGIPMNIAEVNSSEQEDDPILTSDGRELFFSSGRGGGQVQIFHALRCP